MQGYYPGAMLSPRRRQVIIAGLGAAIAPAAFAALPSVEAPQRLVLSGRVLGPDAKPLSGAAKVRVAWRPEEAALIDLIAKP